MDDWKSARRRYMGRVFCPSRMKRLGLFLGVRPEAGGMFQYAQSLLDALDALPKGTFGVTVAYVDPLWKNHLRNYEFSEINIPFGKMGMHIANAMMAARLPGSMCRTISPALNPAVSVLARARCDLWLFPAQDALGYQVPFRVMASIHD